MVEVATSLLDVDKEKIIKTIYDLEVAGTDYFHIDVMDGKFVKNDTIEKMREYTEYIKQVSNTPIDVHLMVDNIEPYLKEYVDMEVQAIIFHIESCKNEEEALKWISYLKENNIKAGITLKPKTKIEDIYKYIPYIHKVLVMSVEPGKGGQEFMPETIEKIKKLNNFIYENGFEVDIEVDGGINDKTAKQTIEAGVNILVAGNYIAKAENFKQAIDSIKQKSNN
jgi:putative ribulose-5-phosphate 3-epimerase